MRERVRSPSRTSTALVPSQAPTASRTTTSADAADPRARMRALQRAVGNRAVSGLLESANPRMAHALWRTSPEVDAILAAHCGRPLETALRSELEPLVGGDLSG